MNISAVSPATPPAPAPAQSPTRQPSVAPASSTPAAKADAVTISPAGHAATSTADGDHDGH